MLSLVATVYFPLTDIETVNVPDKKTIILLFVTKKLTEQNIQMILNN